MPKSLHPECDPPCGRLLIAEEQIRELQSWRTNTETSLKEIRDVISQVKLLMSLSIGGGGLSIITLIATIAMLLTGNK
jgi:hypothetical protein